MSFSPAARREMKKAGGTDSKYFNTAKKGETMELREELRNPQRDRKKDAVKKVFIPSWKSMLPFPFLHIPSLLRGGLLLIRSSLI